MGFNIKCINATNNKEVIFQVTFRCGEYKLFESSELDVIIKSIENKGLILDPILKLTMKIFFKSIKYKYKVLSKITYTNNA